MRPDWLTCDDERLELDFYVEELRVAIEVQGEQHYHFVPLFHQDAAGFKKRLAYDEQKRVTCARYGIGLFEVSSLDEVYSIIEKLLTSQPKETDLYFTQMLKKEIALRSPVEITWEPRQKRPMDIQREAKQTRKSLAAASRRIARDARRKDYYESLKKKIETLETYLVENPDDKPGNDNIPKRITACKEHMASLESYFTAKANQHPKGREF